MPLGSAAARQRMWVASKVLHAVANPVYANVSAAVRAGAARCSKPRRRLRADGRSRARPLGTASAPTAGGGSAGPAAAAAAAADGCTASCGAQPPSRSSYLSVGSDDGAVPHRCASKRASGGAAVTLTRYSQPPRGVHRAHSAPPSRPRAAAASTAAAAASPPT